MASVPIVLSKLTVRQQEILRRFVDGPNELRIARQLGLSRQTVANHLSQIQRRVGVHGRTELMKAALLSLYREPRMHFTVG